METAKPSKFESAIEDALGFIPERPDEYKDLESRELRFYDLDDSVDVIKDFIEASLG